MREREREPSLKKDRGHNRHGAETDACTGDVNRDTISVWVRKSGVEREWVEREGGEGETSGVGSASSARSMGPTPRSMRIDRLRPIVTPARIATLANAYAGVGPRTPDVSWDSAAGGGAAKLRPSQRNRRTLGTPYLMTSVRHVASRGGATSTPVTLPLPPSMSAIMHSLAPAYSDAKVAES
jgi:hypothetical protein